MKLKDDKNRLRRIYLALVQKGQAENGNVSRLKDTKPGYENHHIQPRVWGASDHPLNLVRFTYRQHYVAHLVLSALMGTKFNLKSGSSRQYADKAATVNQKRKVTLSEKFRKQVERVLSGADLQRSETLKNKPMLVCPHCGKSGGGGMTRWHFDNCRLKTH
ncbi:hypothetical protein CB599_11730 [Salmonella enterica subsp. enterica serovar Adjame]|nr:hypothetical protein [Salmonella enterica subsp. enterica serovar Adjame]